MNWTVQGFAVEALLIFVQGLLKEQNKNALFLKYTCLPPPWFLLNLQHGNWGRALFKSPSNLTGEKPDPDQTFKLTSLQNFSSCLPNTCTTLVSNHNISHRQPETVLMETPQDTIVSFAIITAFKQPFQLHFKMWIRSCTAWVTKSCLLFFLGVEQDQPRVLQCKIFLFEHRLLNVLHWLSCNFTRCCPSWVRNCHLVETGSK